MAGEKTDIAKIDKAMAVVEKTKDGMDWYKFDAPVFELNGFYWFKPGSELRRLPLNTPELNIPSGVDELAWHTAGGMLRFKTDADEIRLDVVIHHNCRMDHMAHTGIMGFDVYAGSGTDKYYVRTARFNQNSDNYLVTVYQNTLGKEMREFTIHFPLYAGVKSLSVGLTQGAAVQPPTPWKDPRPIVVYGTSIQQGGCASRPGMCHTNRMSRMLNRPFINQAYSGSGKGEPAMAKLLAEIKNPAMYVLDYDANAHVEGLRNTLPEFLRILREKHPETPILLVSRLPCGTELDEMHRTGRLTKDREEFNRIHKASYDHWRNAGDKNIYFLDGLTLYGQDASECTVDGSHGTDLGFYMIANAMAPVIRDILDKK